MTLNVDGTGFVKVADHETAVADMETVKVTLCHQAGRLGEALTAGTRGMYNAQ